MSEKGRRFGGTRRSVIYYTVAIIVEFVTNFDGAASVSSITAPQLVNDVLTKYVYSAVETKTQTVLAGGKVSSLGGTVAGKVAKRFLQQLQRGRP